MAPYWRALGPVNTRTSIQKFVHSGQIQKLACTADCSIKSNPAVLPSNRRASLELTRAHPLWFLQQINWKSIPTGNTDDLIKHTTSIYQHKQLVTDIPSDCDSVNITRLTEVPLSVQYLFFTNYRVGYQPVISTGMIK